LAYGKVRKESSGAELKKRAASILALEPKNHGLEFHVSIDTWN
jgi:hypothetical protein